ncbi:MAG: hypothetical protein KAH22_03785 [Thiotrichaceae bacterium]|nr:hypothetical protein [Thiotrichaceae bacterium]
MKKLVLTLATASILISTISFATPQMTSKDFNVMVEPTISAQAIVLSAESKTLGITSLNVEAITTIGALLVESSGDECRTDAAMLASYSIKYAASNMTAFNTGTLVQGIDCNTALLNLSSKSMIVNAPMTNYDGGIHVKVISES